MRLYLAVAVLMLAFVAYTEAQDASLEDRFSEFGVQVKNFATNTAEKAKNAFEDFHNSENVQKAKNWLQEKFQQMQNQFS